MAKIADLVKYYAKEEPKKTDRKKVVGKKVEKTYFTPKKKEVEDK